MQLETRYARLGPDRIAYQVLGAGPPDLVMTTGNYSHVDLAWEDPGIALFLHTLASFSRLILFDASPMALFFAGTRPERTRALVLANAAAKLLIADDFPIGVRPQPRRRPALPPLAGEVPAHRRQSPDGPGVPARQLRDGRTPHPAPDPGPDPGAAPAGLRVHPHRARALPGRARRGSDDGDGRPRRDPGVAEPLGAFGAVTQDLQELVGGQVTGER